jgi:hypothetical protein
MRPNRKELDKFIERLRVSQEAVLREIGAVQLHAAELRSVIVGIEQTRNSEGAASESRGKKSS